MNTVDKIVKIVGQSREMAGYSTFSNNDLHYLKQFLLEFKEEIKAELKEELSK